MKSGRILLAAALGLSSLLAQAQLKAPSDWRKGPPDWATAQDIEAEKKLRNLCFFIGNHSEDDEGSPFKAKAVGNVVRAAGLTDYPDTPAKRKQVREAWERFESHGMLVCNNLQFDVPNGSALKYAVSASNEGFIHFAAEVGIGLTRVDDTDGRTVLDYVQYHASRARGEVTGEYLKMYYEVLRKAGAKHRNELSGYAPCTPSTCWSTGFEKK